MAFRVLATSKSSQPLTNLRRAEVQGSSRTLPHSDAPPLRGPSGGKAQLTSAKPHLVACLPALAGLEPLAWCSLAPVSKRARDRSRKTLSYSSPKVER